MVGSSDVSEVLVGMGGVVFFFVVGVFWVCFGSWGVGWFWG